MKEPSMSVVKAAGKALDIKGLTSKLIGPAFEELGAICGRKGRSFVSDGELC